LVSGGWSVIGYTRITPFLYEKFGLHDTCGIHNLHGMPGIIGAIAGIISAATASPQIYGQQLFEIFPHGNTGDQWKYQLACLGHSFGIAIVGGFIFGFITQKLGPLLFDPHIDPEMMFDDEHAWEVPHEVHEPSHQELKEKHSV
jgi:ammonium transporter Rh